MTQFDFSVLKTLRQKRSLTADQLAGQANVTRGTVAKMEAGFDNPTIQTIQALAAVFGLTTSGFLKLAEGVHLEQARVEDFSRPGYAGKRIYFDNLEIYRLKAREGTVIESEFALHEDTAEVCFVLSGHLTLTVGDRVIPLEAGAAARFRAMYEHRLDVRESSEFLLLHHSIV